MKIPSPLAMIWLATILLLIIIKPAASQLTLSPNLTVYDTSGLYSGKPPMVKTSALTNIQPCTDLQKMYQEPKEKRVQILND